MNVVRNKKVATGMAHRFMAISLPAAWPSLVTDDRPVGSDVSMFGITSRERLWFASVHPLDSNRRMARVGGPCPAPHVTHAIPEGSTILNDSFPSSPPNPSRKTAARRIRAPRPPVDIEAAFKDQSPF